jgi:MqsR (Motility quorum-sensing regulator) toxin of toxin-antitoxin system
MPRWLSRVLRRVHALAGEGSVRFTFKALQELALLDLDGDDAVEVLRGLTAKHSAGRLVSARTGEWMYVFQPAVGGITVYLKLVLRTDCVVVSFHHEERSDDED